MDDLLQVAWMDREMERWRLVGAGAEIPAYLFLNPVRLVPKKGPKLFRLVSNMRKLNKSVMTVPCIYEDLSSILKMIHPRAFFVTRDMQDGYFHVKIHPDSAPLLAFRWRSKILTHLALPFSLTQSPGIFTQVIQSLILFWRKQSLQCVAYLDDIFLTHLDLCTLLLQAQFI